MNDVRSTAAPRPDVPDWVPDAVFYQIFPDRFARSSRLPAIGPFEDWDAPPTYHGFKGGDLYGIAERLVQLEELGITALYLTPVFASASNHRYHTYDYLAVDPVLGGDPALRELLDRAHERGMRVILDGVFNHCGRGFWPFHHVLENGAQSPYRDWFHLDPAVLEGRRDLNAYPERAIAAAEDGGTSAAVDPSVLGYQAWWNHPALPKFNTDHPAVREYLLTVAEHWLRLGTDGWRLDVPAEIDDADFWREFRRRCRAVNPDAYLVGEIWHVAPDWLAGDRFDALMNYPLGAAILGYAAGEHLDQAVVDSHQTYSETIRRLDGAVFGSRVEELMSTYEPAVTGAQLNLIGSHDAPRALTLMGGNVPAVRLATLLQLVLPGAPCIYYGDEIGMEGGHDPDNRRGYPPDPEAGDRELRAFVRATIAARRENRALRTGSVRVLAATDGAVAFLREADGERAIVAINAADGAAALTLDQDSVAEQWKPLALPGWPTGPDIETDEPTRLEVPGQTAFVYVAG